MTTIDLAEVRKEMVYFLRNDITILTPGDRGVTNDVAAGSFSADTEYLINRTNVKNVRSVTVGGGLLTYGTDYTVDVDYDDSGTIKCRVAFTTAQTGVYSIVYDYGDTDKIFPDFPKSDLTLSSFPRIGCDILNIPSRPGGFGNVNVSEIDITIVAYAAKTKDLSDYITDIRAAIVAAQTGFYYVGKVVKPLSIGPILKSERSKGKDKIFQQNIDIRGFFNYEKN